MRRGILTWFVMLFTISAAVVGCGPSKEEKERMEKQAQLGSQLAEIESSWQALRELRTQLAEKRARLEELEAKPRRKRTAEEKAELESLPGEIEQLASQVDSDYEALQDKLATFLNLALNEFPEAPETKRGLEIYSEEAMVTAADHVKNAGDFKKAIEILATAKSYYEMAGLEPYQPLLDRIARYQELRYITRERFDAVKKGMTEKQVTEVAGPAYYGNRREDPKRGITFWLYPKREGGAAAIYFNKKGKVYAKDWNAVKPKVAEGEG